MSTISKQITDKVSDNMYVSGVDSRTLNEIVDATINETKEMIKRGLIEAAVNDVLPQDYNDLNMDILMRLGYKG